MSEFSVFGDYTVVNTEETKYYDYSKNIIDVSKIDNIVVTKKHRCNKLENSDNKTFGSLSCFCISGIELAGKIDFRQTIDRQGATAVYSFSCFNTDKETNIA